MRNRRLSIVLGLLASVVAIAPALRAGDDPPAAPKAPSAAEIRKARQAANELLRKYQLAKEDAKRAEIAAKLEAIDIRARVPAYVDCLKEERPAAQRYCIERLAAFKEPAFVPHFVLLATGPHPKEVHDSAHSAAVGLHEDYTRRWYEHVIMNDLGSKRLRAIPRLGEIKSAASVPLLATVYAVVGLEIRVQVARLQGIETVPVNLGSANAAATQVPIQLPTIELLEVNTNVQVPAAVQSATRDLALAALRSIAGKDLGTEPEPYRAWWKEQGSPGVTRPAK